MIFNNRHEFLSQYLGGGAILMKAKRSITNSFDHLIKRKGRDGVGPLMSQTSLPHNSTFNNVSLTFNIGIEIKSLVLKFKLRDRIRVESEQK